MKKKTNASVPYPLPAGYYVPTDPKVKKKRNTTPIIVAVSVCLVFAILFGSLAVGFFSVLQKTVNTLSSEDFTPIIECMERFGEKGMKILEKNMDTETAYLFRYAAPYEKSGITFSEETTAVEKGPFSFTLPKKDFRISEEDNTIVYLYNDDQGSIRVTVDTSLYYQNEEHWREDLADEPFLLDDAQFNARVEAYTKMFGYNPFESIYAFDKACFTTRYWELNYDFPDAGKMLCAFLQQKYSQGDSYDMVFTRDTDTYRGFVLSASTEDDVTLFLNAYLPDIDEAQYCFHVHCTGSYANDAYAILNSVAFVPQLKEETVQLLKEVKG